MAPSNRRAAALCEKAPETHGNGSSPLGLTIPHLAPLALDVGACQARNGCRLASQRLPPVLDLEGTARTTRTAGDHARDSGPATLVPLLNCCHDASVADKRCHRIALIVALGV